MNDNYFVQRILGNLRRFLLFVIIIVLFMLTGVGIAYLLVARADEPAIVPAVSNLPQDEAEIGGGADQTLTVNAQLQVKGQFYLVPTSLPDDAEAGTLVFDNETSTLQYFNGTAFVPLTQQAAVPQGGVTSFQGQTGAVTLVPGAGMSINGTTIANSGILGINGVPGDIGVTTANGIASLTLPQSIGTGSSPTFAGLSLSSALGVTSGGTGALSLTANGVIIGNGTGALTSVAAVAPGQCLISTAGAPAFGACAGGGAAVDSLNSLVGNLTIANASGVGTTITINDASTAQKGIAQFNSTNFSAASGTINTIQNIATTSSPTFAGLTLTSALSVSNGGTGLNTLTSNAVIVGNGVGSVQQISSGGAGQCLVSTAGAPIFAACPGSGGVTSIDGQSGIVTVSNATGAANNITIDDASTAQKGIAQFNSTNFSAASGTINTIQNIANTSSPTFNGLSLTSLTMSGDNITDFSGTGLIVSGNALQAALGTSVDLTSEVNGTLPVANGGTGAISFTSNGILFGNGSGAIQVTAAGTTGQCLVGTTGSAPSWAACPGGSGITSITLAGTSGTPQTITDGNTITIAAGTNITTTAAATDTVTVAVANNPTFSGLITANGGLTVEAGDTLTFNGDAITDLTGNGLTVSSNALTINIQANKGLEVDSNGLSLIDCGNNQILKYSTGTNQWACAGDGDTTYTAGNDIDITAGQIDVESQLDFVGIINRTSANLTLQTTTTGDILVNPAGNFNVGSGDIVVNSSGNTTIGGTLTGTGLATFNGGLTVEAGDTFTFNGEAFDDLTGSGLVVSSGDLAVDATSATGFFRNGGNAFAANSTLGNTGNFDLNVMTNNLTRLTIQADGDVAFDTDALFVDATANSVGINTTSPGATLGVDAGNTKSGFRVGEIDGLARYVQIGYNNATSVLSGSAANTGFFGGTTSAFVFEHNVGVDASETGMSAFLVQGAPSATADLVIFENSGGTDFFNLQADGDLALDTDSLFVDSNNNRVGVGDATPDYKFEIQGTSGSGYFAITNSVDGDIFSVDSSGNATLAGALSVQGNTTLGNANSDTLTVNAGTSGTGIRFADGSFASCTALETDAQGDLTCGSDDAGAGALTAGNDIDINASAIDIESQLDFVSVINRTAANLTLQTTTSGDILVNSAGSFNVGSGDLVVDSSGNTAIGGTLTVTSTATFNGNSVIGNANSDTLTVNAGTSGTGIRFTDASFASCSALETDASGDLTCGTDDTGGGSGDNTSVNGAAATDANFINTAASGTLASITWSLNTTPSPDEISLTVGAASDTEAGVVTTGTQTFAGAKTFNDNVILGNANSDTLTVNAGTSGTGIRFVDASFASCTALETDAQGDLTCGSDADTDTTYTAGNDLDLTAGQFDIEAQLDFVTTINRTSANLTLQTTTSGDILVNPAGNFNVGSGDLVVDSSGNTAIGGTLTVTSTATFNGNTVVGNANTDTLTVNAGTSGTGVRFVDATFANCTALETDAQGDLVCGTDDGGGGGGGDNITINGLAAADANFINSAASGTLASITWSLNTTATPDEITLSVGAASDTEAGVVTTGTQTFAGAKTFNGNVILGDANTDTLTVNAGTSGSGIRFIDASFASCSALETDAQGDLVCGTDTDTDTTYTAGNDLDLTAGQFDIESQLDFVSVINRTAANLTLQTTTSGDILVNPAGNFNVGSGDLVVNSSGNTTIGGTLTVTGLSTLNGGLTVEAGDTFTFNGDGFTDFTGGGLFNNSGQLSVVNTGASGFFQNGGNSFGVGAVLGTNDSNSLVLRTNSTAALTIDTSQNASFAGNLTVAAGKYVSLVGGNTASRPGSPTEGMMYFDSDIDRLLIYSNGKWQADRSDAILVAASNSTQTDKDVADYVADGNGGGAGDGDQVQINSALTAASGKKVVLLAGTYVADASISIPNNTTLAGVGEGSLIELADIDATDNLIENTDQSTGTGVTVRDLKLDGRDDLNTAGTQAGIAFIGIGSGSGTSAVPGGYITNVSIEDFLSYGIQLSSSSNNLITHSKILRSNVGIIFSGSNNKISDNLFLGNDTYGINIPSATNSEISNNIVEGSATSGIRITGGNNNLVTSNSIRDNGGSTTNEGIYLQSADFYTITNNVITDTSCTSTCRAVNISNAASDKNYFEGNRFSGSTANAASISDSGTGTIFAGQQNNSTTSTNSDVSDFVFRGSANSATAFLVQNATGTAVLSVNTSTAGVTVSGTLNVSGAATLTSSLSVEGNSTIGNANSDTLTVNAGTSGTGIRFTDASFASCTALETDASGDLTCGSDDAGTTYTAGNDLDLTAGQFDIESQLDFVSTINRTGANLTLQTTTSGDILVNPAGSFNVGAGDLVVDASGNTSVGGTLTVTSTGTFNGNVTIGNANSDTVTFNSGTSGTGIRFTDATFANCTALETDASGDLTCGTDTDTDTTYTAGNDLDLTAGQFDIESQLDFVATINRTSANLTLQTTTSGDILVNPAGSFNVGAGDLVVDASGNTSVGGTLTVTSTGTFNGNVTIGNANSDTVTFNSGTSGTGIRFTDASFASCTALETDASGDLTCGSDTDTTYTAGNDIDITAGQIDVESQLDFVSTINRTSANLTLQTTTTGDILVNSAGSFNVGAGDLVVDASGNTAIGGTLNVTGATTFTSTISVEGNSTLGNANTDTVTINAGTSGTGIRFTDATFANCTALETDASGDLTCGADTDTTYTAGNDIDITAGQIDIESQLDFVSIINRTSANLTLQTTTSGDILVNPAGSFNVGAGDLVVDASGNTTVGGTSTHTGLATFNGGLTVEAGDIFTFNSDAFDDLTGSGLTISSGDLTVDATSATGFFRNGGNGFGGLATLGTTDANALSVITGGTQRAIFTNGNTMYFGNASTAGTNASPTSFTIQGTSSSANGVDGGDLTVRAGAGNSSSTGSDGGILTLRAGSAGGSGGNDGGNVIIRPGAATGAGTDGDIILQSAAGGQIMTVNGSRVTVGSSTCSGTGQGRFCINQNASGSSGNQVVNQNNSMTIGTSAPGYHFGNNVYLIDTSSAVANLNYGMVIDSTDGTNNSAVIDSIVAVGRTTQAAASNLLRLVSGGTGITTSGITDGQNVLTVSNVGDTTFSFNSTSSNLSVVPLAASTVDLVSIDATAGSGITTDNVDGLYLNIEAANGTSTDVAGVHIDFDPITGSSDDTFTGLLIDAITGTAAVENALTLGSGWDANLFFNDTTTQIQIADGGTFVFEDVGGNDLLTVADAGSVGNVGVTGTLVVAGTATMQGVLSVEGNTTLGNATSDTVTFTGRVASDILPTTNDTYDLGSDALRWKDLYLGGETLHIGTSTGDEGAIGYNTTTNVLSLQSTGTIAFSSSVTLAASQSLTIAGGNTASRPGSPTEGMVYFDTTTDALLTYANSKWQSDRGEYIIVASGHGSDPSTQAERDSADYVTDGTSDETEINAALSAATGHKVVLLPGTYTVDGTILVPNFTTLAGSGKNTIIEFDVMGSPDNLIQNSDTSTGTSVIIRDLLLNGRIDINAQLLTGIYLEGIGNNTGFVPGAQLININTLGFTNVGVVIDDSDGTLIEGSDFQEGNYGISVQDSDNTVITGSTFRGTAQDTITLNNSDYSIVNNNSFNGVGLGVISSSSHSVTISSNSFNTIGSRGVWVINSNNNSVSSNTFRDMGGNEAIFVSGTATQASIVGNNINTTATNGIGINTGTSDNLISGNIIANAGSLTGSSSGIIITSSNNNTVTNNRITDTAGTGYAINVVSGTANYLSGNYYSGTGASSINNTGTDTVWVGQNIASATDFIFRGANSANAFRIMDNSGTAVLTANTSTAGVTVGGTLTVSGLTTLNGGLTVETGDTFTFNGDAFTDFTGGGLFSNSGTLSIVNTGASGYFQNGGNTFAAAAVLGTNDSNSLTLRTNSTTALTIDTSQNASFAGNLTVAAGKYVSLVGGNTASRPGSPTEGMVYFDTDTDQLLTYANGKWQADRNEAVLVAANDSSDANKAAADYIADGTDDQVQINAALTAASSAGTRKTGKVFLFAGTYTTHRTDNSNATILIPNNVTLAGAGNGTLIRLGDTVDTTDNLIENSDTSTGTGVVVRDLMLDGQDSLQSAGTQYGIFYTGMGSGSGTGARLGGQILNVVSKEFRSHGIGVASSSNNIISGNTTQGNGSSTNSGIFINTTSYTTITGNVAQGNTGNGININSGTNLTISGNTTTANSSSGIFIGGTSNTNTITGNATSGNGGSGIETFGSGVTLNTFSSNTVSGNTLFGLLLDSPLYNTFSNNTITSNPYGMFFSTAHSNTITGNFIRDNGGATLNRGIYLTSSDFNTITNNYITDTGCTTLCYAIDISNAASEKNYLEGNRYIGSAANGATINNAGTSTIFVNQQTNTSLSTDNDVSDFLFRGSANSATAFLVQNASGTAVLTVNTSTAGATIAGTLAVTGAGTFDGDLTFGNATTDNISFTGRVSTSILPLSNDAVDLGSDSNRWRDLFLGGETFHIGTSTSDEGAIAYTTSTNVMSLQSTGGISITPGSTADLVLAVDSDSSVQVLGTVTSTASNDMQTIDLTNQTSSGTQRGLVINNVNDAANATTEALLLLANAETTINTVTDYMLITAAATDTTANAINVSDTDLFNGIYMGSNFARFDGIRIFEGATGTLTFEDTSGNDLVTVTDAGTTGNVAITGTLNVANIVPTANLTIGTSDATGTLLILDTKTGAGDPSGSDGAMYFNAASMRFRCYEGGRWIGCTGDGETNFGRVLIKDEFISGTGDETGEIGELGWAVALTGSATDTSVLASPDTDHVGIYQCSSSTTNPSGCLLNLGNTQTRIWGGEVIGAVVRTPSNLTATNMYVGLGDATTGTGNSTDAVQLRKISGTANWEGNVISNGTPATCDTGIVAVANEFVQVKIVVNAAANSTSFYLNGATTASCSISNGLPTASGRELGPIWQFRNADVTASKTGSLDLFWFERYVGDRWD